MHIIKKIGVLVILTLACLSSVYAQDSGKFHSFSLSPQLGFLYGQSDEIVYKFPGKDLFYSRLYWDIKPLFYGGLTADIGPKYPQKKRGFLAALDLRFGLPLKVGIMEDWDWLNILYDYPTHYSIHDAISRDAIFTDLSAGYSAHFHDRFTLNILGEFSYMHFSWSAINGYIQYPPPDPLENYLPWDENYEKKHFKGKLIKYTQDWLILSPGISLKWDIGRFFSLSGFFNYSPLLFCIAMDNHLQRKNIYYDYLSFGRYIKGGGEIIVLPLNKISYALSVSYKSINGIRGDTYFDSIHYLDTAGAGYSSLDFRFAVKYSLF